MSPSEVLETSLDKLSPADEEKKYFSILLILLIVLNILIILYIVLINIRLGNEQFVLKNYDEAIKHYTNAITLDPENAIYYSNRSACFAGKQLWKESMIDAEVSLLKDPSFIKAYYRLSIAQLELKLYDDAIQTLQTGLTKDPENDLLAKQVRIVRQKRTLAQTSSLTSNKKQLTETQKKEIVSLQDQTAIYSRDLKNVQLSIQSLQREARMTQATKLQIENIPTSVPLYKGIGKVFVSGTHNDILQSINTEQENNTKQIKDLMDRQEY